MVVVVPGMRAGVRALTTGPPCILNATFCTLAVLNHVNSKPSLLVTQPLVTAQPVDLVATELFLALNLVRHPLAVEIYGYP